jgi:hypothetical protein
VSRSIWYFCENILIGEQKGKSYMSGQQIQRFPIHILQNPHKPTKFSTPKLCNRILRNKTPVWSKCDTEILCFIFVHLYYTEVHFRQCTRKNLLHLQMSVVHIQENWLFEDLLLVFYQCIN